MYPFSTRGYECVFDARRVNTAELNYEYACDAMRSLPAKGYGISVVYGDEHHK